MVAGRRPVEPERQRQPHRGRPQVADLAHEAGALELLGAHPRPAQPAQGLGVGLARADGRVGAGGPLGGGLEARQRLGRRRRVGVEEHLEAVARLGLGAQAPDVVDLAPGPRRGAQAGEAARAADQEGGRPAGREGVGDALVVADQVVGGHHQRRRPAGGGQRGGQGEGVERRPRVAADVERHDLAEPERPGQGGRELAQPEGRALADRDQRPRGLGALEGRDGGLVGHRQRVLVEGRRRQRLGARPARAPVELLDLPQGGPVAGQVGPVPDDLPHA